MEHIAAFHLVCKHTGCPRNSEPHKISPNMVLYKNGLKQICVVYIFNSPVSQNARPCAVALASYTEEDKITKSTVGFTRKDI